MKSLSDQLNESFGEENTSVNEAQNLLKQSALSSAEYQKAKKLKDFDADNYKWDSDDELYRKINESLDINESLLDVFQGLSKDELTLLTGAIAATGVLLTSAGAVKLIDWLKKKGGKAAKIIDRLEELGGTAAATAQQK